MLRPALRVVLFKRFFERLVPDGPDRLQRVPPPGFRHALRQYDLVCTISQFSQRWIERYWGLPARILSPPVAVDAFAPQAKKNVILNVGRFFVGGHNKKQLEQVRAFKRLCQKGLTGWELHLVGSTEEAPRHRRYVDRVQVEAQGYPVYLHLDAPFADLRRLYGQAQVYWHASGYGEDTDRQPGQFEHFGITTVEAMAAGCVPVVIGKAGQREIVSDGTDGFLWQSLDDLAERTMQLIRDPALWEKMSLNARRRSRDFGQDVFAERALEWVNALMERSER
jgi:glycosyltransferase involved in cell wall biosynthesis